MESLAAVVLGMFAKRFIDRMKKLDVDAFEALVLFCMLCGVVYAMFQIVLPVGLKESVISFVSTAGLAAVSTHELLKRINTDKRPL